MPSIESPSDLNPIPLKWVTSDLETPQKQASSQAAEEKVLLRLEKKLLHYTGKAIHDFKLIKPHDKILVCVSGGKDSITLLILLKLLKKRTKVPFEIFSFTLDQAQPGWDDRALRVFLEQENIPYEILREDTYTIVTDKIHGGTYCGLCSRLRRGIIYRYAKEKGFNKIALGHHRDDLTQALLMGLFYNGEIRSMPPKLITDDHSLIVIRPLVYAQEKDIAEFSKLKKFPIIPCSLCGSQPKMARNEVKRLIQTLAQENPKIPSNLLRAIQNVRPSQLMDKKLWSFGDLEQQIKDNDNDNANDDGSC